MDIIGRGEAFSKHRCLAGSRFFTTDNTRHLKPEGQCPVHAIPKKLRSHDYFFKLNDEVWILSRQLIIKCKISGTRITARLFTFYKIFVFNLDNGLKCATM